MTHHRREQMMLTVTPPDTRSMINQPTASSDSIQDEAEADVDEPPDDQARTPRPTVAVPVSEFGKHARVQMARKESVLTQMLSQSSDNSTEDDESIHSLTTRRGFSTTSTWSNPSLTDDNGMTSPGTRATTPSPPPPVNLTTLPPPFNTKLFDTKPVVIRDHDAVDPLEKPVAQTDGEKAVEAALGRKRVCMFACGNKKTAPASKPEPAKAEQTPRKESPPRRKCMLTFACPTKASKQSPPVRKPSIERRPSPAPLITKTSEASISPSTLRKSSSNLSQQTTIKNNEKTTARSRRLSTAGEADTEPTERFCMSNEQRTEDDDWMKERTCHRSRLTVDDTLTKELNLRKIGKEAEEEEEIEDEAELDNEGIDDAEDVDDEDGAGELTATGEDHSDLDDGFDSDDEAGMGESSDEDDSGSDYEWWAPGRSTAATSYEHLDQMHFTRQRNFSGSSIGSVSSTRAISGEKRKPLKKRASIPIQRNEPDLPDSTDFVCGTLDEDRPMEEAYKQEIEKRRAAQHVPCPQDIDPTFPTSDPEMDEEDDEDVFDNNEVEESDMHVDGVFGNFEAHEDKTVRGRPRGSPAPSPPKRVRSPPPKRAVHRSPPPPAKKAVHRSPPPRKLFGSPPKRLRSPAPAPRLRSPPPTRRPSFAKSPKQHPAFLPIALAERPHGAHTMASSLPRRPNLQQKWSRAPSPIPDLENDDGEERVPRPARGAIDIVKGLEKKKQFRREKLYRKYCWQRANGDCKRKEERKCLPGKGAEKMREMGLELAGRGKFEGQHNFSEKDAEHVLSL